MAQKNKVRRILTWGAVALAAVALVIVFMPRGGGEVAFPYPVEEVTQGQVRRTIEANGILEPTESVEVGAQVSGQLLQLYVDVGDQVEQGQLLAEIDAQLAQAQVDSNRAQLNELRASRQQTVAQLNLERVEAERAHNLYAADAISEGELEAADTALLVAEAELAQLDARIERVQYALEGDLTSLRYTQIYAPASGTVISVAALPGQTLNANYTAPVVLTIADLSRMTVSADIPEADVTRLTPGTPATFTTSGDPEREWETSVRQILPQPEVISDVVIYKALLDVENEGNALRPQMTVQATFDLGQARNVVRIPAEALSLPSDLRTQYGITSDSTRGRDGARNVLVMTDAGVEPRQITVGLIGDNYVEVTSGLTPGERVVTNPTSDDDDDDDFNFRGGFIIRGG